MRTPENSKPLNRSLFRGHDWLHGTFAFFHFPRVLKKKQTVRAIQKIPSRTQSTRNCPKIFSGSSGVTWGRSGLPGDGLGRNRTPNTSVTPELCGAAGGRLRCLPKSRGTVPPPEPPRQRVELRGGSPPLGGGGDPLAFLPPFLAVKNPDQFGVLARDRDHARVHGLAQRKVNRM